MEEIRPQHGLPQGCVTILCSRTFEVARMEVIIIQISRPVGAWPVLLSLRDLETWRFVVRELYRYSGIKLFVLSIIILPQDRKSRVISKSQRIARIIGEPVVRPRLHNCQI